MLDFYYGSGFQLVRVTRTILTLCPDLCFWTTPSQQLSVSNIWVIQYIFLKIQQMIVEMPRCRSPKDLSWVLGDKQVVKLDAIWELTFTVLIFLTHSWVFALLSISLLCVAVWSSIRFKLRVLTEGRRKFGEEGRHPAEGPSWAAPVECSACEFSASVRKIGVDSSQPHIWPLHCRGHKARQVYVRTHVWRWYSLESFIVFF